MEWLFSWEVTSWAVGIFVAIAVGVLALDDFKLAKLCFLLAAADAIGGIAMGGTKSTLPTWATNLVVIGLCGMVGFLALQSWRYVDGKEEAKKSPKPSAPYAVHLDVTMFSPRRDTGCMIFIAYPGLHGQTLSPANAAVFLTIVNDQPIPVMLSDYSVEMRTADGSWAPLIRMSAIGKTMFMGSDTRSLARVSDNSVFLDTVIAGRTLQPHDPVRGWSLFEYPKRYGPTFVPEFKVTLKDYEGTTYTSPILTSSPGAREGAQVQSFPIAPGKFDLSKAFLKYWSDPVVP